MIKITSYHLDVLANVTQRLADLANSLPDNSISFSVELTNRPYSIVACVYEWSDLEPNTEIKTLDTAEWFFERHPEEAEQNRLYFLTKIAEWEVKYGLLKSKR